MAGLTAAESFLKSILDIFRSKTSNGFRLGSVSLTGTATPLPAFKCKAVELLATATLTNNGVSVSYTGGLLPCNDASEIVVSGSGTLTYIIYL